MKHSRETIRRVLDLSNKGYSSRQIELVLGVSKSSVNDIVSKYKNTGPRIALLDLETSATLSYHFDRWDIRISDANVQTEGGNILVGSFKWLNEGNVTSLYQTPNEIKKNDDRRIVSKLYDLYDEADAIIMHNGKKFDHKVMQTRGLYHNLGALPTVKIIDTLQIAKKHLRLPSNRLDSIGKYFDIGRKVPNDGIELWKRVQKGDKQAMKDMVEYCAGDIILLENVFNKFMSLGIDGFNASLYYNDTELRCKKCGSNHVHPTGRYTYTGVSKFSEYTCEDCGSVSRDRINELSKEKRKNLLT